MRLKKFQGSLHSLQGFASGFPQDIERKSVGFFGRLIYVFLRFTLYVIFFNVLCYCLRELFYVFCFTFTFTFYLVFSRFCKMKIRKRKIVVSFYKILFVNLYFTFTFTFGEFFYFFVTFSILRFFTKKTFYEIKT